MFRPNVRGMSFQVNKLRTTILAFFISLVSSSVTAPVDSLSTHISFSGTAKRDTRRMHFQLFFSAPVELVHRGSEYGILRCCPKSSTDCGETKLYSDPLWSCMNCRDKRPFLTKAIELSSSHHFVEHPNRLSSSLVFIGSRREFTEQYQRLRFCNISLVSGAVRNMADEVIGDTNVVLSSAVIKNSQLASINFFETASYDHSNEEDLRISRLNTKDEVHDSIDNEDDEGENQNEVDSVDMSEVIRDHLNYLTNHYKWRHTNASFAEEDNTESSHSSVKTTESFFTTSFLEVDRVSKIYSSPSTGERLCEENPLSHVCDAVRKQWAQQSNDLWPALFAGLSSTKAKVTPKDEDEPSLGHHPFSCINHDMKNVLPFRDFGAGNISKLRRETVVGTHAAVIGHTLSNFAMAEKQGEHIEIIPVTPFKAQIVFSKNLHARQFLAGDFIALQGFHKSGNSGSFQVTKNIDDNSLEIMDLQLNDYRRGHVSELTYESNAWGAKIAGCWSKGVESLLSDPITVYGNKAGDQRAWIKYPHTGFKAFELGEIVRLTGFTFTGNNGLFRVDGMPGRGLIRLGDLAPCSGNSQCRISANKKERTFSKLNETLLGVHGVARNNFIADPIIGNIRIMGRECTSCNGHGTCVHRKGVNDPLCECYSSWVSDDCSLPALPCPESCSGHGVCESETGTCHCETSWSGLACDESTLPCPNDCSGHGACSHLDGHCSCDSTWCGISCASPCVPCPNRCSGHGKCSTVTSKCFCDPSWGGIDCRLTMEKCPENCNENGKCEASTGKCYCDEGWHGLACDRCGKDGRGKKGANNTCICDTSWTGSNCDEPSLACPTAKLGIPCTGHGVCKTAAGQCTCTEEWTGLDCALRSKKCPLMCSGHGVCDENIGECSCDMKWSGNACEIPDLCPGNCSGPSHGYCHEPTKTCKCRRAWEGSDCSKPKCGRHGIMAPDGSCRGDPGWYAPIPGGICDRIGSLCTPQINCVSHKGTASDTCSSHASGCSNVGACLCDVGWTGAICDTALEPTGEQVQRTISDATTKRCEIEDQKMRLHLAIFLVYASSRETVGKDIGFKEVLEVFRERGKSMQPEGALRANAKTVMASSDLDRNGRLCVNEFLYALLQPGAASAKLIPSALNFVFARLDKNSDGQATFVDLLWGKLESIAVKKIIDDKVAVGTKLKGVFSAETGSTTLVASVSQQNVDKSGGINLHTNGQDILMIGKHVKTTTRVYTGGTEIEMSTPWIDKDEANMTGRLITKYTILEMLDIPSVDLALIEHANEEDPPPIEQKLFLKAWHSTYTEWIKLRSRNVIDNDKERSSVVTVDQFHEVARESPTLICTESPYCDDVMKQGSCLQTICSKFCHSASPQVGSLCAAGTPLDWNGYVLHLTGIPCIRSLWGEARLLKRKGSREPTSLRQRLVILNKLEGYIAKALLENPTKEAIRLKQEFEKEKSCALHSQNASWFDDDDLCVADMDDAVQETHVKLTKVSIKANKEAPGLDFHCNGKIDFKKLWDQRNLRFSKAKAQKYSPIPGPNKDNNVGGQLENFGTRKEKCADDSKGANGVACCDNCDPANIPICPLPDPQLNDLIQHCTCGQDTGPTELMDAGINGAAKTEYQVFQQDMYPPHGFDSMLKMPSRRRLLGMEPPHLLTGGASILNLGPAGPGFSNSGIVLPYLKRHVYTSTVGTLTNQVSTSVYEQVRPQISRHLTASLARSCMAFLNKSLTHALEHSIGNNVALLVNHGVRTTLTTTLPRQLMSTGTIAMVKTMTRALTHSLAPALVSALGETPAQREHCYLCKQSGIQSHCPYCDEQTSLQIESALQYLNYYASYYSDYYADFYTKSFVDNGETIKLRESEQGESEDAPDPIAPNQPNHPT